MVQSLANVTNRGETEDLGRFHFDLNFPSPAAPPLEDPVGGDMNDMEDFELAPADVEPLQAPSDDDDDAGGDFGFGLDFPPAGSPSASPGIVGGGLRDEAVPTQGKQKKISRHGIPVPNLPAGVVKKLATRFARSGAGSKAKMNKATLAAIEQASAWYFEQASQDLAAYSKHAGRKTIDESDVTTLLRRSVASESPDLVEVIADLFQTTPYQ
jgi:histone H3/H4